MLYLFDILQIKLALNAFSFQMFLRISERFQTSKLNDELKQNYENFLVKIGQHFFDSFFDGANFSRRCIALECLDKLFNIFGPIQNLAKKENSEILIRCLDDSYEKNKVVALSILDQFPSNDKNLDDVPFVKQLWYILCFHLFEKFCILMIFVIWWDQSSLYESIMLV